MSSGKVSSPPQAQAVEAVLIDVLRMLLQGRGEEVPERVRKLVTTQAGRRKSGLSESGRSAIALLLAEEAARPTDTRRGGVAVRRTRNQPAAVSAPAEAVPTPILAALEQSEIDQIVHEYANRERLAVAGLSPTRTVLLSGPPGVGKSMTMQDIARRIGRPLIRVESSDVIGSLLGESARSLSALFAQAKEQRAVLGLDEIDALAKRRDDAYDVGEFKRFVSTLLVELDRWPADAPLIAATNYLELLDPALERRFETHLRLGPPDEAGRDAILRQSTSRLGLAPAEETLRALVAVTNGGTGATLDTLVHRAARRAALNDEPIDRALLLASTPPAVDKRARELFAAAARDAGRLSSRTIGELLGCSHTAAQRMAQAGSLTIKD